MSRVLRVVLFRGYKTSTGLVGLNVDKNGRETLLTVTAQVLSSVKVRDPVLRLRPCRGSVISAASALYLTAPIQNSCFRIYNPVENPRN